MKVVVTGAAGYVASQLLPAFRERYDLVLLDTRDKTRDGTPVEGITLTDLRGADRDPYRGYFQGADAVVHLAFNYKPGHTMNDGDYYSERANLDLAYHVYQTGQEEGVRRFVIASSNHAADWYEHLLRQRKLEMLDVTSPPLSDNYYGWAKACYEHLGFLFATGTLGRALEIVQVRIGAPRPITADTAEQDPTSYKRNLGAYISPRDIQQLFIKSIETPDIANEHGIPFQIFYGVSNNARAFWSIANARKVIGYAPVDDSEVTFADDIRRALIDRESGGRL
jgi:hypothetical protein